MPDVWRGNVEQVTEVGHQNACYVYRAVLDTAAVIRAFAHHGMAKHYTKIASTPWGSEGATLADAQPCPTHRSLLAAPDIGELFACDHCGPWLRALGTAHSSGDYHNLNVR